jgi:hypothetical protein
MRGRRALAAAALAVLAAGTASPAWAGDGGTYPPTGPQFSPTSAPGPGTHVQGVKVIRTPGGSLPFTGQEIAAMSVGATALLGWGLAFALLGRRRRDATES